MKKEWWVLVILAGALGAFFATTQLHEPGPDMTDMGPLEIRADTTRLLEPTAGGAIDYTQALNDVPAVAPADNAALPLLRLLGTDVLSGNVRSVLEQLGAPADLESVEGWPGPPEEVADALASTDMAERGDNAVIAGWIGRNQGPLDALVAASRRPRFWSPVVRARESNLLEPAFLSTHLRELVDALATRAEIARVEGRPDDGWQDVQALLRLYVLVEEVPGFLSRIVATTFHRAATEWVQRLLVENAPAADLCTAIVARLASLAPPRSLAPDLDTYERYMILDALIGNAGGAGTPGLNPALGAINAAFDEAVALFERIDGALPDRVRQLVKDRRVGAQAITAELGSVAGKMERWGEAVASRGASVSRMSGELVATTALAPLDALFTRVREVERQRHVLLVAAALRLHLLRSGSFPPSLDALVPTTIAALPASTWGASPVPYAPTESGCRVGDDDFALELSR